MYSSFVAFIIPFVSCIPWTNSSKERFSKNKTHHMNLKNNHFVLSNNVDYTRFLEQISLTNLANVQNLRGHIDSWPVKVAV